MRSPWGASLWSAAGCLEHRWGPPYPLGSHRHTSPNIQWGPCARARDCRCCALRCCCVGVDGCMSGALQAPPAWGVQLPNAPTVGCTRKAPSASITCCFHSLRVAATPCNPSECVRLMSALNPRPVPAVRALLKGRVPFFQVFIDHRSGPMHEWFLKAPTSVTTLVSSFVDPKINHPIWPVHFFENSRPVMHDQGDRVKHQVSRWSP